MSHTRVAFGLCGLVLSAALVPRSLHAADDGDGGRPHATFFTGVGLDNEDSRRFDLGMKLRSRRETTFELVGSRSDAEFDAESFYSTVVRADLSHDFGRFGLGGGVLHIRDEEVVETLGWSGSGALDFSDARVTGRLEYRSSDFADSPFTASGADLGLPALQSVSGTAACSIASFGYRLGLNVFRGRASFYGSGAVFDYSSYECAADVQTLTPGSPAGPRAAILVRRPRLARQLASSVINRRSGYSGTLAPSEATLLESSFTIGAGYALGSRTALGMELYRDTEEFAPVESSTLLGYVELQLSRTLAVEFTLGATDTAPLDSSVFAGVQVSASLGK